MGAGFDPKVDVNWREREETMAKESKDRDLAKQITRRSFMKGMVGLALAGTAGSTLTYFDSEAHAHWVRNRFGHLGGVVPVDPSNPSIVHYDRFCKHGGCQECSRVCQEEQTVFGYWDPRVASEVVCVNCGQCTLYCPGKRGIPAMQEVDDTAAAFSYLNNSEYHVVVQTAPAVRVSLGEEFGLVPGEWTEGQLVAALRALRFDAVFDTNFSADLTIMEEASEFIKRVVNGEAPMPMFTSCCPGWVKFLEYFYPSLIPNLSSCKSPQQMLGAMAKTYYAEKKGIDPAKIICVAIMPCTAKKFEAQRPEMVAAREYWHNDSIGQDVDLVLTTRELARMIKAQNIDFINLPEEGYDSLLGEDTGAAKIFGATGGVMEAAVRTAYHFITGEDPPQVLFALEPVRGLDGVKEAELVIDGMTVKVAVANGLKNARAVCDLVKDGNPNGWHFIEFMACRGGCIGGGGQPRTAVPPTDEIRQARIDALYSADEADVKRASYENEEIQAIYEEFLEPLGEERVHELLHTHYTDRGPVV